MKKLIGSFGLFALVVLGASSCKKDKEAKAKITVLEYTVDIVSGDTVEAPAVGADVRFYLDIINAEHIDTTIKTDTKGEALFSWFEDAIIQYDVLYPPYSSLENFVILEQGETEEITVIIGD